MDQDAVLSSFRPGSSHDKLPERLYMHAVPQIVRVVRPIFRQLKYSVTIRNLDYELENQYSASQIDSETGKPNVL